jgi:nicotinamidase-related amidase
MSDTKALLVIDVQHGLIDGPLPHYEKDAVLANIAGLLEKALAHPDHQVRVQPADEVRFRA